MKFSTLIIAEKPSVARDIARVVGATESSSGYYFGNSTVVSWAVGHLVTLQEPFEIQPDWKTWKKSTLPMIPSQWPLKIIENTRSQYQILEKLLDQCKELICATDAGREGELIFRYIIEKAACHKPFKRLWISSLTPEAIQKGLKELQDSTQFDGLANAARGRSRADWLVGMNYSRAYALSTGEPFFVGRVQTPTLALVVQRDLEIKNFKPETYFELIATFRHENSETFSGYYCGTQEETKDQKTLKTKRFTENGKDIEKICQRVLVGIAKMSSVKSKEIKEAPPLLYDLTELQRDGNRLFSYSAAKTLEIAQELYEKYKLISYPRTDSRHLSQTVAETLPHIVSSIRDPYESLIHNKTGIEKLGKRFIDDEQISDHHAIIPTGIRFDTKNLSTDEWNIYDLICRRLLSAWQKDYITSLTTVLTEVKSPEEKDIFQTQGTALIQVGWRALDLKPILPQKEDPKLPGWLELDLDLTVTEVKPKSKTTQPPPHLNEATLLSAMEYAGRKLENKDLAKIMRECGIGTPATRASIIETLLFRKYIERQGKALKATELGIRLIETVHDSVKSPELTAQWEQELSLIQAKKKNLEEFMTALEKEIKKQILEIFSTSFALPKKQEQISNTIDLPVLSSAPMKDFLKKVFGFDDFRPHQEEVCKAVSEGKDVLLVMPTGAGKSLCYQLPGLVRGGTTLVISPLLALIEDQVEKIKHLGIRADRIHSGRNREESRQVCRDYLSGKLSFLFVAPERLAVPGFLELLSKRPPSLIAIDEAHCISHWGHDFRPNYRLLGERLYILRPAPVIALTATATPIVQEDIVKQLRLDSGVKYIHGFRRKNIAIEVIRADPSQRLGLIFSILREEDRLPAIVYAPTRKAAEKLTCQLKGHFRVDTYHAGMSSRAREDTQSRYLTGQIDIIVATIAFGMGIDKNNVRTVIHAGLPGSIESYYQEIGRAGRDGKPSRAILLHSYVDQKTHEFFLERDYPDLKILQRIYEELDETKKHKNLIFEKIVSKLYSLSFELFEKAIEKLWIHQGVKIDPEENATKGIDSWEKTYLEQAEQKRKQLRQMVHYTEQFSCRMRNLIAHFGDQNDSSENCGICEFCNPTKRSDTSIHQISQLDQQLIAHLMAELSQHGSIAAGKLFQNLSGKNSSIERSNFEKILKCLVKAQWIQIHSANFEKDGKSISYRKVCLLEKGQIAGQEELEKLVIEESSYTVEVFTPLPSSSTRKRKRKKTSTHSVTYTRQSKPTLEVERIVQLLKSWRLDQARKRGIPAFRIMSDRVLMSICENIPSCEEDFLQIKGIGPKLTEKYGNAILKLIQTSSQS